MVKETEVPWYQSFDCRSGNHSDCMFNGTNSNTAIGFESLFHANGSNNTGLGDESLYALDKCGCACHKENKLTDENGDEI